MSWGFHMQRTTSGWLQAVAKLPAGAPVKAVDDYHMLRDAKQANPGVYTVFRKWYDHAQTYDDAPMSVKRQRARDYFNTFIDGTFRNIVQHVDAIGLWNEEYAASQTQIERQRRIDQDRAFLEVWVAEYHPEFPHIDIHLTSAAPGNSIPVGIAALGHQYRKFSTLSNAGALLDYHAYTAVRDGQIIAGENVWCSGRWIVDDAAYRQAGYTVKWFLSEIGATGWGNNAFDFGGWRDSRVYGGNLQAYLGSAIKDNLDRWDAWARANPGRFKGGVAFTVNANADPRWFSYEMDGSQMATIADFVRAYNPVPPPPPPPPPPDPPPASQTRSFEDGHTDLSPRLQQPTGFTLSVIPTGQPLWYPRNGQTVNATGTVEAKRLECGKQLPVSQCVGGSEPLILDGIWNFKIQPVHMQSGTSLKTTFTGNGRGRVTVPVNVHWQGDLPNETDDVYAVLILNGAEAHRLQHPQLKNRQWATLTGEADFPVTAELRFQTSWPNSRDCFTDLWRCETVNPPNLEEQIWADSIARQIQRGISLNPDAGLQQLIFARSGYTPVTREETVNISNAAYGYMAGEHVGGGDVRRVWYFKKPWSGPAGVNVMVDPTAFILDVYPVKDTAPFVTSDWNAPRDYDGDGNYDDFHEGLDLRVIKPSGTIADIIAAKGGVVDGIRRTDPGTGYGVYVRTKHTFVANGVVSTYYIWYAHMSFVANGLAVGQTVVAGTVLGRAGSSGNADGPHLHLTVQKIPGGLGGYAIASVINPRQVIGHLLSAN